MFASRSDHHQVCCASFFNSVIRSPSVDRIRCGSAYIDVIRPQKDEGDANPVRNVDERGRVM
jgi:hypothetical protein